MTSKPTAVIVDMDGTLADVSSILHYVLNKPKNFDAFHAASADVPANQLALDYATQAYKAGHTVIVVTGRMARWYDVSSRWLDANMTVPFLGPLMRPEGDYRSDVDIKHEIYNQIAQDYDIVGAIDDRPSIVELWQSLGIETVVMPNINHATT